MAGRTIAGPRGRYKAERTRQRRRDLVAVALVAFMVAPVVAGCLWVLSQVDLGERGEEDVLMEVQVGWGPPQVAAQLKKNGIIRNTARFEALATEQAVTTFSPGRYYFVVNQGSVKSLATLSGDPALALPDLTLLLPPGLTIDKIADRVATLENRSRDRFLEVANSGTIRSKYEPEGVHSLEGLTWPDTYKIGANETETQILQKIVNEFDKRATAIGVGAPELNAYNVINVAAMIQKEAGNNEDMPLISAVIWNRITKGMPLQIDATLCYAKGGCPPVPVENDKKIDSPYNTYQVNGLPPTPIASVGQAALDAALHPSAVDYLYYVADKNGKTYFASTLPEHERNITKARNVE